MFYKMKHEGSMCSLVRSRYARERLKAAYKGQ